MEEEADMEELEAMLDEDFGEDNEDSTKKQRPVCAFDDELDMDDIEAMLEQDVDETHQSKPPIQLPQCAGDDEDSEDDLEVLAALLENESGDTNDNSNQEKSSVIEQKSKGNNSDDDDDDVFVAALEEREKFDRENRTKSKHNDNKFNNSGVESGKYNNSNRENNIVKSTNNDTIKGSNKRIAKGDNCVTKGDNCVTKEGNEENRREKLADSDDSDWEGLDGEKRELSDVGRDLKELLKSNTAEKSYPSQYVPKNKPSWTSKSDTSTNPPSANTSNRHLPALRTSRLKRDNDTYTLRPLPFWKTDKKHDTSTNPPSAKKFKPSSARPTSVTSHIKKDDDAVVDPFSGIRIINPLISSTTMGERMQTRRMIKLSLLQSRVKTAEIEGDWVTMGVIVHKSDTRKSANGNTYSIWKLSDLDTEETVSFFLFNQTYKQHWKRAVGAVIGLLNSTIMKNSESNNKYKEGLSITIDHPDQLMMIGQSKDLGWCRGTTKAGNKCTNFLNKRSGEYCLYHVQAAYKKSCVKRADVQTGYTGITPKSYHKKIIPAGSCVFYQGQTYTTVRGQKPASRVNLKKLQQHSGPGSKLTTLSLCNIDAEDKSKLKRAADAKDKQFLDMLHTPTVGSMNLVKHIAKTEKNQQLNKDGDAQGKQPIISVSAKDVLKQHKIDMENRKRARDGAKIADKNPESVTNQPKSKPDDASDVVDRKRACDGEKMADKNSESVANHQKSKLDNTSGLSNRKRAREDDKTVDTDKKSSANPSKRGNTCNDEKFGNKNSRLNTNDPSKSKRDRCDTSKISSKNINTSTKNKQTVKTHTNKNLETNRKNYDDMESGGFSDKNTNSRTASSDSEMKTSHKSPKIKSHSSDTDVEMDKSGQISDLRKHSSDSDTMNSHKNTNLKKSDSKTSDNRNHGLNFYNERLESDTDYKTTVSSRNIASDKNSSLKSKFQFPTLNPGFSPVIGRGSEPGGDIFLDFSPASSGKVGDKEGFSKEIAKQLAIAKIKAKGGIQKIEPKPARKMLLSPEAKKRIQDRVAGNHSSQSSSDNGESDHPNEPPRKKSRYLGNIDLQSAEVQKLLKAKSSHKGAVEELESERKERYFNNLEKKEMYEEKLGKIMEIKCTVYSCAACGYETAFGASDLCKKEGHPINSRVAMKKFFECRKCKHRTVSIYTLPTAPCIECGEHSYVRTAMVKEKKGPKLDSENLCLRGDEQKWLNSLK